MGWSPRAARGLAATPRAPAARLLGQLAVERAAREHARPRSTSSRYTYAQPSEATRRLIEAESETDMRLYAHAVGLLHARLRRCGLRPATPRLDLVASGARS